MSSAVNIVVYKDGTVLMQSMRSNTYAYIDIKGPLGSGKSFQYRQESGWSSQKFSNEISANGMSARFEKIKDGEGGTSVHLTGDFSADILPTNPIDIILEYNVGGGVTGVKVGGSIGVGEVITLSGGIHTSTNANTNLPMHHVTISPDGNTYVTDFVMSHPSMPGSGVVAITQRYGPTGYSIGKEIISEVDEDYAAEIAAGLRTVGDECFIAGTMIDMWPVGLSVNIELNGRYDEALILSTVWQKPIEKIQPDDVVLSYDKDGRLKPGRVTRTFQNTATHILDFWGVGVTPGHAYLCGDGKFEGQHVPIMDILRTDGAIIRDDGTLIRANIGCELGSIGDRMIHVITGKKRDDGLTVIDEVGQIRLGTRIITSNGKDVSILDLIHANGGMVTEDGYIQSTPGGKKMPFRWTHSRHLPKPEEYILKRSEVDLDAIYLAGEWESIGTRMGAPESATPHMAPSGASTMLQPMKPQPNIPPTFADHPEAPRLNRKQRKLMETKREKGKSKSVTLQ